MNQNQSVADARYKKLRALLELLLGAGGGNPGSLLRAPVDVAAGATVNMAHGGDNNFAGADGVGNIVYNLPADAQPGDLAHFKMSATGATPSLINARGGADIEDVGAPGTYKGANGQTQLSGQGAAVTLQMNKSTLSGANGRWQILSGGI